MGRSFVGVILCVFMLMAGAACEDPQQTQTQAFEKAEAHYRTGEYDAALDGYQAFLEAYPTSPLAETAELRIRSIHREVRSVLMRKDMPRPRYIGGTDKAAPAPPATSPPTSDTQHSDSEQPESQQSDSQQPAPDPEETIR